MGSDVKEELLSSPDPDFVLFWFYFIFLRTPLPPHLLFILDFIGSWIPVLFYSLAYHSRTPSSLIISLSFIFLRTPFSLSRLFLIDAKHRLWFHVFMFHMTFTLYSHRPPLYVIASQPHSFLLFLYLFHLRDPDYFPISSRPPFSINSRLCIMVQ